MRKSLNSCSLNGRLYQHTLEVKTSKKGVTYIGGTIDLATDDACLNIVTVNYTYVAPTYPAKADKPERPNPNYATLEKIINSGKTVVTDGADAAMKLRLSPSLTVNDFQNRDGEMIAAKRLDGGFVTIINALPEDKLDKRNYWEADVLINGTVMVEPDEERGITEGYLTVKGNVFNFAGAIQPVDFIVKSEGGIKYFESLDASNSNPVFLKCWGAITSTTVVTKREEENVAFGVPAVREFTRTTKHWEITGAKGETYEIGDAEQGITADEIQQKLADRKVHLAEVKKNAEEYAASRAITTPATATTGTTAATGAFNW